MYTLAYMSKTLFDFTPVTLQLLLDVSKRNNSARGLTGILLYDGANRFVQVLEGQLNVIQDTFRAICRDERHFDVELLFVDPLNERRFPDWSMGLANEADLSFQGPEKFNQFVNMPDKHEFFLTNQQHIGQFITYLRVTNVVCID